MPRPHLLPMLLVCALALTGCGDATSTEGGAADAPSDASDIDDQEPAADKGPDPDDGEADQAAPGPSEPLTGDEGWAELHDVPLPEPGRMELTFDGQVFATDVRCGQDPVRNDEASGAMFLFSLLETGVTDDGRDFRIMVNRAITVDGQVDELYDTGGSSAQVTLAFTGEEPISTSAVLSPNDDDPRGERLPLVHVDPSGGFTMQGTMEAFQGDNPVTGDAVLAGRCQEGWPG